MLLLQILIFQFTTISSTEKWFNYVVISSFFENGKKLGRSDDGKRRKKKRMNKKQEKEFDKFGLKMQNRWRENIHARAQLWRENTQIE